MAHKFGIFMPNFIPNMASMFLKEEKIFYMVQVVQKKILFEDNRFLCCQ